MIGSKYFVVCSLITYSLQGLAAETAGSSSRLNRLELDHENGTAYVCAKRSVFENNERFTPPEDSEIRGSVKIDVANALETLAQFKASEVVCFDAKFKVDSRGIRPQLLISDLKLPDSIDLEFSSVPDGPFKTLGETIRTAFRDGNNYGKTELSVARLGSKLALNDLNALSEKTYYALTKVYDENENYTHASDSIRTKSGKFTDVWVDEAIETKSGKFLAKFADVSVDEELDEEGKAVLKAKKSKFGKSSVDLTEVALSYLVGNAGDPSYPDMWVPEFKTAIRSLLFLTLPKSQTSSFEAKKLKKILLDFDSDEDDYFELLGDEDFKEVTSSAAWVEEEGNELQTRRHLADLLSSRDVDFRAAVTTGYMFDPTQDSNTPKMYKVQSFLIINANTLDTVRFYSFEGSGT